MCNGLMGVVAAEHDTYFMCAIGCVCVCVCVCMATNWQILCKDLFQLKVPATSCQHELDGCSMALCSRHKSANELQ